MAGRPSRPRVSNDLLSASQALLDFLSRTWNLIHPCLGTSLTSVPFCLTGQSVRCKFLRQQASSPSVAYTLLGGFIVAVCLSCALPEIQNHLMVFKYNIISLIVKERVR